MMVRQCMFPSVSPHALSQPATWDAGAAPDGLELSARDPTMASERHPFGLVRRVPSSAAQQVTARRHQCCAPSCISVLCVLLHLMRASPNAQGSLIAWCCTYNCRSPPFLLM